MPYARSGRALGAVPPRRCSYARAVGDRGTVREHRGYARAVGDRGTVREHRGYARAVGDRGTVREHRGLDVRLSLCDDSGVDCFF